MFTLLAMTSGLITELDRIKQVFSTFKSMPEDERTQLLAVETAKAVSEDPHRLICECFWKPFALLYDQMVKRSEITRIEDIGRDKALMYWTEACVTNPDGAKWKKIMIMRALYMFDLISEKV